MSWGKPAWHCCHPIAADLPDSGYGLSAADGDGHPQSRRDHWAATGGGEVLGSVALPTGVVFVQAGGEALSSTEGPIDAYRLLQVARAQKGGSISLSDVPSVYLLVYTTFAFSEVLFARRMRRVNDDVPQQSGVSVTWYWRAQMPLMNESLTHPSVGMIQYP